MRFETALKRVKILRTGNRLLWGIAILSASLLIGCQQQPSQQAAASVSPTNNTTDSGQHLYLAYCASCHGIDGKGMGPAASALRAQPVNLTQLAKNNHGTFPAERVYSMASGDFAIAAHGSKDMPTWGPAFLARSGRTAAEVEQNIRSLVRYIELLQKDLVTELRKPTKP